MVNFASFFTNQDHKSINTYCASAARGVLQSVACYFALGEAINWQRALGIGVTLAGSVMYSLTKTYEKNRALKQITPINQEIKH